MDQHYRRIASTTQIEEILHGKTAADVAAAHLHSLKWDRVCIFCERIYKIILTPEIEYDFNSNPEFALVLKKFAVILRQT